MDRHSPLAPAFVRVLVLPVGSFERERFLALVDGLKKTASVIELEDVARHVKENDILLSPKDSSKRCILYNFTTSIPSEQHYQLSPYELFREPLLVLGLVDGLGKDAASGLQELSEASRYLRERHQRVVHRQLVLIDPDQNGSVTSKDVVRIGDDAVTDAAQLKDAIVKISARFLGELSTYTRALQASPSIQTPGQTARSLQRSTKYREHENRPGSGQSTPTHTSEAGSPIDDPGARPQPYGRSSPATSFDQIASASNAQNALSRSDSRTSNRGRHAGRTASQDRVSVQGFGSMSQDKLKSRGKARVGIVTGYLFMMAGQWSEAVKILAEHTNKARSLSDNLWNAKGMESIVVCLLLHAWAGIEFQIPSICYPIADRMTSGHSQRFSMNLPSDFATPQAAQRAALHRLSTYLPDLIKQTMNLYDTGEASLELPFVVISEATIRACKLLLLLRDSGELDETALRQLLDAPVRADAAGTPPPSQAPKSKKISKSMIADMLADAQPTPEDNVQPADQVACLAGIASVYASMHMRRKKAAVMREMVSKLTSALTQARKSGAAEMGMHPTAALSTDTGADGIMGAAELSGGLHQMLEEIAGIYGVSSLDPQSLSVTTIPTGAVGSDTLKHLVLTELSAFCEASPDLQGILRVNATLMSASRPGGTADAQRASIAHDLSTEDQVRLTSTIAKSVGISKHLGLPNISATYWDRFMVRDVRLLPLDASHTVVSRASVAAGKGLSAQQTSTNPLLYDPNAASRPGTASAKPLPTSLVQGESTVCIVTLQNPFDVSVEVEQLSLRTEGVELTTSTNTITLGPLRMQDVPLQITPTSAGQCKVIGCSIKVAGCAEQDFAIFKKPWSASPTVIVKEHGQQAGVLPIDEVSRPEEAVVHAEVVESQPFLKLEDTSRLDEGIMLLGGESRELSITVRNESSTAASIANIAVSNAALHIASELAGDNIAPGARGLFKLLIYGKSGLSDAQATLYYRSPTAATDHVRAIAVPINVTVNPSLQVQGLEVVPSKMQEGGEAKYTIVFDVGNPWPKTLDYRFVMKNTASKELSPEDSVDSGSLSSGRISRVFLAMRRDIPGEQLSHGSDPETVRLALLRRLIGRWSGDEREGDVDCSILRPSVEALEMLRGEPVHLRLELVNSDETGRDRSSSIKAGSFATVRATLTNNGTSSTPLVIQLQPRTPHLNDGAAEERHVAVAGAQHRVIPLLGVGAEAQIDFTLCPLLVGCVVVDVVVRPAHMLKKPESSSWHVQRSLSLVVT